MAGDPLDVIGSMTVHARRPRLWVQAGSTPPVHFNRVHIDGRIATVQSRRESRE